MRNAGHIIRSIHDASFTDGFYFSFFLMPLSLSHTVVEKCSN